MPKYTKEEYLRFAHPLPRWVKHDSYGIPYIENTEIDLSNLGNGSFLINFKNTGLHDQNAEKKIVHLFLYDKELFPIYNNPYRYLEKLGRYRAVFSPDFSIYKDMDFHDVLDSVYKNRYVGAAWQSKGVRVIPSVGWCTQKWDDICFAGLRENGIVAISTLGVNNCECKTEFLRGYNELLRRKSPKSIVCLGDPIGNMEGNICFIPYDESFGHQFENGWQAKLFNWNEKLEVNNHGI
jgi:hypothetical protein